MKFYTAFFHTSLIAVNYTGIDLLYLFLLLIDIVILVWIARAYFKWRR